MISIFFICITIVNWVYFTLLKIRDPDEKVSVTHRSVENINRMERHVRRSFFMHREMTRYVGAAFPTTKGENLSANAEKRTDRSTNPDSSVRSPFHYRLLPVFMLYFSKTTWEASS